MPILSILFGLIDPVTRIVEKLAQARLEQTKAQTDREKIASDERIAALEARKAVLIAEANTPINALVRAAFSIPLAIYFAKIVLWDKVIMGGASATDDLTPNQWVMVWIVLGFYFVSDVTRILRR